MGDLTRWNGTSEEVIDLTRWDGSAETAMKLYRWDGSAETQMVTGSSGGGGDPAADDAAAASTTSTDTSQNVSRTQGTTPILARVIRQTDDDPTRVWIPTTRSANAPILVLFHGAGGDHNSVNNVGISDNALEQGWIVVSPNFGGPKEWTSTVEQARVNKIVAFVRINWGSTLSPVAFYATSMGGSLSSIVAGRKLVRDMRGVYVVNGAWNIQSDAFELAHDPGVPGYDDPGIYAVFNNSVSAISAQNPSKTTAVSVAQWTAADPTYRFVYDSRTGGDPVVDPDAHSIPFSSRLTSAGVPWTVRTHTSGHSTPSFASTDAVTFFDGIL